jgi:hypothetical protein
MISHDRTTLKLHRWLREIAGFRAPPSLGWSKGLAANSGFWVNRLQ